MTEERKSNIKKSNLAERLTTYIFYASVFIFLVAFNFSDSMTGGWYQQFLPSTLDSTYVSDITFTDSLTGYAVTGYVSQNVRSFILKTTNGGDNWNILRTDNQEYNGYVRVIFFNKDTGYVAGFVGNAFNYTNIERTTNGGLNWSVINYPYTAYPDDIFILNKDTIWVANSGPTFGGLFRTTNGGMNWTVQYNVGGSGNPEKIYMYNARIGFMCTSVNGFYKTTNCGDNWVQVAGENRFTDIKFTDSLTGLKVNSASKKTTNGGMSWITQYLPSPPVGNFVENRIYSISSLNNNSIWGSGGDIFYNGYGFRGFIYRTTNGGSNWGYQIPDTTYQIPNYTKINFINNIVGWAYHFGLKKGIHTVIGGDTTVYTNIINTHNQNISSNYELYQNYPNPYNQYTIINVQLKIAKQIKIEVFDLAGKRVKTIINKRESSGLHSYKFDGSNLSSGVYFYTLFADGERIDTKKMLLIK